MVFVHFPIRERRVPWLKHVPHVCARLRPQISRSACRGWTDAWARRSPWHYVLLVWNWMPNNTHRTNLLLPSVSPDNLRPEAGLEDWRGEMGSCVSDWVAPHSPTTHTTLPRASFISTTTSLNLPLPLQSTNFQRSIAYGP